MEPEKDFVLKRLMERKARLQQRCLRLQKGLSKSRKGHIRIVTKRNKCKADYYQYYLLAGQGDARGTYLKKSQLAIAREIAQRDYETSLLAEQQRELAFVEHTISGYVGDGAEKVIDSLHPGRRCLVKSAIITDEQFAASWMKKKCRPNPYPEAPRFQTASHVMVRSKSEMIIADCLLEAGISFHYEFAFSVNGEVYYPDFYCLLPHSRKEFIWEHFGRMDDASYCERMVRKVGDYQQCLPDEYGLVLTFEDGVTPFSKGCAQSALKRFLQSAGLWR